MPKKKKGGKKRPQVKRELPFREDGQEYCQVIKMLGGARFTGSCFDGKERLCIIRGSMSGRRKVWMKEGDIVLVGLRDWQDGKCDVILKYTDEEIKRLKAMGELPSNIIIGQVERVEEDKEDLGFDFEADFDDI